MIFPSLSDVSLQCQGCPSPTGCLIELNGNKTLGKQVNSPTVLIELKEILKEINQHFKVQRSIYSVKSYENSLKF